MKLYVCWETRTMLYESGYPCSKAYQALRDAGYWPRVTKCYGHLKLPEMLNQTPGRRAVKRLAGNIVVPALVTDDGEIVQEAEYIIAWAHAHPARADAVLVGV